MNGSHLGPFGSPDRPKLLFGGGTIGAKEVERGSISESNIEGELERTQCVQRMKPGEFHRKDNGLRLALSAREREQIWWHVERHGV
jgi:hypothetical protein